MYGSATSGAGGSTTETTLTWLSAGQGRRATSSTARSLQGEPSIASRIFLAVAPVVDAAWGEDTSASRQLHPTSARGVPATTDEFSRLLCGLCRERWVVFRGLRTIPQDGRGGAPDTSRRILLKPRLRGGLRRGRSIIFPPCKALEGTAGRRAPWLRRPSRSHRVRWPRRCEPADSSFAAHGSSPGHP